MGSICSDLVEPAPVSLKPITPTQSSHSKQTQTSFHLQADDPSIQQSLAQLSSDLKRIRELHKNAMITSCVNYMRRLLKLDIKAFWDRWRDSIIAEISIVQLNEDLEVLADEDNEGFKISQKNLAEAKDIINFDNQLALRENPLFPYVRAAENKEGLALTTLFRFFEEMMDKKYENDMSNFNLKRVPASMPDFFTEHLNRVYGLKKLAQNALIQTLATLKGLYEQGHSYGRIICRLLQIHDPQPIPTTLALFITRARHELNKIITAKKQGRKIKRLEEINVLDAFNLIYSLFETDKFSRAKALSMLKPKIMTDEAFLLFRICNKIIRMGQTVENIFFCIDTENVNSVNFKVFVEYIKKTMELILSEQDLQILNQIFDPKNTKSISRDQFLTKISIKNYLDTTKNEKLAISKSHFLGVLIDVFKIIQLKDMALLTSLFQAYKKTKVAQPEFLEMISVLDPKIVPEQAVLLYEEALIQNSDSSLDGATLDSFTKIVFRHEIGRRGIRDFSNHYIGLKADQFEPSEDIAKIENTEGSATDRGKSPVSRGIKKPNTQTMFSERPPPKSRRSSNLLNSAEKFRLSRSPTPTDFNNMRSKSPAFGSINKP